MATSKTLTPTNVTIQIPEFTDQPDQRVNSNCIDKEADAINSLNTAIGTLQGQASRTIQWISSGSLDDCTDPTKVYSWGNVSISNIPAIYAKMYYIPGDVPMQYCVTNDGTSSMIRVNTGSWSSWTYIASIANTNSWKLFNTNGNTYPTSSAFLVVVTKSGGNYASVMCHANPSGCNIYFPTIASNCFVYFNGTGGFAASNLPSGYSVSIYTH